MYSYIVLHIIRGKVYHCYSHNIIRGKVYHSAIATTLVVKHYQRKGISLCYSHNIIRGKVYHSAIATTKSKAFSILYRNYSNLKKGLHFLLTWAFRLTRWAYSIPIEPASVRQSASAFTMLKDLLRNSWADQSQILCGASLGRGNDILFAASGSHDQDGRHAHIW